MARALRGLLALAFALSTGACGSAGTGGGDSPDGGGAAEGGAASEGGATADGGSVDAGGADGSSAPGRFVTSVVSIARTECTGFGAASLPAVVEGPPVGGGSARGSTDVVSLGSGGQIVVSFAPNAIVDGPGPDFVVFENPFWIGGSSSSVYAEPGEVSVSDDGATWHTFPCQPAPGAAPDGTGVLPPYGECAGWHVVYSAPGNGISPFDPATAGGDAFDLAELGLTHARYVRIVDRTLEACPDAGPRPDTNGFDLDAVAILNAELP